MKRPFLFFFAALALFVPGCKDSDAPNIAPANLTIETNIASDGSGLVTFHATADHANTFKFYFGEDPNDPFTSEDGTATHNYLSSGTYSARVVAFSPDNLSTEKIATINVHVNEPSISSAGYSTPESYPGMTLIWHDEFVGDELNTDDWNYETGPFNNELQYYQKQNTIIQDG